ncbi:antibiotic biosynthesis monooxygenase [Geobacillus sp. C56-T2]|uniref:antibiotic biosynthesis monooxygenase family protein n=1 Tax=unclassified Geobacillus TaxID=2642459 RepID=UPI0011A452B4|nr:antibiotic biosynthesis monooxygenase family protein [Geobacillus sp. C56-T2]NNV06566.1 antibiotic biosynthesis monooxygenase [Geobacillus sp. MMMUD3]TWG31737.1 heme-degrading monooxygenase HmoA [Geobacillus sp. C56-T2]
MYIVHSTFSVPVEKVDEVIAIYQNRSRLVDKADGFRAFRLLQNEKRPGELTVHIEWESKEAFLAWVTSDEFKRIHELEKNYPDQELASIVPTITRYKVVAT